MATQRTRQPIERNIAMELVRVTEAAAMSAVRYMGMGDKELVDQAAVEERMGQEPPGLAVLDEEAHSCPVVDQVLSLRTHRIRQERHGHVRKRDDEADRGFVRPLQESGHRRPPVRHRPTRARARYSSSSGVRRSLSLPGRTASSNASRASLGRPSVRRARAIK